MWAPGKLTFILRCQRLFFNDSIESENRKKCFSGFVFVFFSCDAAALIWPVCFWTQTRGDPDSLAIWLLINTPPPLHTEP